jgi:hypothetical protein
VEDDESENESATASSHDSEQSDERDDISEESDAGFKQESIVTPRSVRFSANIFARWLG